MHWGRGLIGVLLLGLMAACAHQSPPAEPEGRAQPGGVVVVPMAGQAAQGSSPSPVSGQAVTPTAVPVPALQFAGVIEEIRATEAPPTSGAGVSVGSLVGSAIGSTASSNRFSKSLWGGLLGGLIGLLVERESRPSYVEIVVRLDDGQRVAVVQEDREPWSQGERVRLYQTAHERWITR